MSIELTNEFKALALRQAEETLAKDYLITLTEKERLIEGAGFLLSHAFGFDGLAVLKITYVALEDSNFHAANETIQNLIDAIENDKGDGEVERQ